ncbi:MAG: hypothetical protein NZZ41_05070 [Candidatus Dojkabacteria bacterium]|nr:hypothetical protein [Candidatus Dojkabacteria bacterium]
MSESERINLTNRLENQNALQFYSPYTGISNNNDTRNPILGSDQIHLGLSAVPTLISAAGGFKSRKQRKAKAKQDLAISDIVLQAASTEPQQPKRRYVRPEDQLINPNELAPTYGTGTEYLAQMGATVPLSPFYLSSAGAGLGNFGASLISGSGDFSNTPEGQVGSTIGGIAGSFLGPAGTFVGSTIGSFIGNMIGKNAEKKIKDIENKVSRNMAQASYIQALRASNSPYMEKGGKVGLGGDLSVLWGGNVKEVSYNPYIGPMVEFDGQSHNKGGIGVKYGDSLVEVENEPAVRLDNDPSKSLVVFGDLKIPEIFALEDKRAKGKKFKQYANILAKDSKKAEKEADEGLILLTENDSTDPYDKLKFNSGKVIFEAANSKLMDIADKKSKLVNLQQLLIDNNKGKAKKGKLIPKYQQSGDPIPKKILISDLPKYEAEGYKLDQTYTGPGKRYVKKGTPDQIIPGKEIYVPIKSNPEFEKAFAEARKKGLKVFEFRGKQYTTELAKEPLKKKIKEPDKIIKGTPDEYILIDDEKPVDVEEKQDLEVVAQDQEVIPQDQQIKPEDQKVKPNSLRDAMLLASTFLPYVLPANRLPRPDLTAEQIALATNRQAPVPAQLYHPLLSQYTDISYQDALNRNQATFNNLVRVAGNNPEALAALAAQKYEADNAVKSEELRRNIQSMVETTNLNRNTLNDAQLKNLAILEDQARKQSMAASATRRDAIDAIASAADKIDRFNVEQRILNVYDNLHGYRFTPGGQAINLNIPAMFSLDTGALGTVDTETGRVITTEGESVRTDAFGFPKDRTKIRRKTTIEKGKTKGKYGSIIKMFNDGKLYR